MLEEIKDKQRVISGRIENNKIVLDDETDLPEGAKVYIVIAAAEEEEKKHGASGLCGIWEDDRTAEEIIEDIYSSRTLGREISLDDPPA